MSLTCTVTWKFDKGAGDIVRTAQALPICVQEYKSATQQAVPRYLELGSTSQFNSPQQAFSNLNALLASVYFLSRYLLMFCRYFLYL